MFNIKMPFKSDLFKRILILEDRFYPSPKGCAKYVLIKEDTAFKDRVYRGPSCGIGIDLDFNTTCNSFKCIKKNRMELTKFTHIELDKLINDCIKNNK